MKPGRVHNYKFGFCGHRDFGRQEFLFQASKKCRAYFARGTVKLNDLQFDEAILDFDKALEFEPYFEEALSNRAFARIRKYQFGSSRKLLENKEVTVMASKDNAGIPENELTIICSDLKQAIFLGDRSKMTLEAFQEFCGRKSSL